MTTAEEEHVGVPDEPVAARLVFLSASAERDNPLGVDREYRGFREGLIAVGAWDEWHPAVEHVPAAEWDTLPRELSSRPSIVHFAGHGHPDGSLEFATRDGRTQRIAAAGVAAMLRAFSDHVRLVVLNACYSDALADAILQHIDVVIGMPHAIADGAAIQFSPTFYQQLAAGRSVHDAFLVARALLLGKSPDPGEAWRNIVQPSAGALDAGPRLRVRDGRNASRIRFVPLARRPAGAAEDPVEFAHPHAAAAVRRLLHAMHLSLQTGYAANAVIAADDIAEIASTEIARRSIAVTPPGVRGLGSGEPRHGRASAELRQIRKWLARHRAEAIRRHDQVSGELDAVAVEAAEVATRLATAAGLVTEAEVAASPSAVRVQASEPDSPGLLKLDRKLHRQDLADRLGGSHRVVVLVTHGESDQGHKHFGDVVTAQAASWDPLDVSWPRRLDCLGSRLGGLYEELARQLGIKANQLRALFRGADLFDADPGTPDGAAAWRLVLDAIRAAIDARREPLLIRHVVQDPFLGASGDDALAAAYLHGVWKEVAAGDGPSVVVCLDLRRRELRGLPLTRERRRSRAELEATREIASVVSRIEIPRGVCVALPELDSVSCPDLADWLHFEHGRDWEAAQREAEEDISASRGGRFDGVVDRLRVRNLHRNRDPK